MTSSLVLSRLFIFLQDPLHGYKVVQLAHSGPDLSDGNKESCLHATLKAPFAAGRFVQGLPS